MRDLEQHVRRGGSALRREGDRGEVGRRLDGRAEPWFGGRVAAGRHGENRPGRERRTDARTAAGRTPHGAGAAARGVMMLALRAPHR